MGRPARPRVSTAIFSLLQDLGERAAIVLLGIDEQHARLAAQAGGGGGAIVFRHGVERGEHFHFVGNEIAVGLEIGRAKFVVAGLQLHVALLEQKLILIELHLRRGGDVAANVRGEIERLAGFQPARHVDFFHEHFRRGCIVQRHGEQLHALRGEARRRGGRLLRGVVAIGQQHDAPGLARGKNGAGKIERAADVRGLALGELRPSLRQPRARRGLPQLGVFGETDHAGDVVRALRREARRDEIARFFFAAAEMLAE